MDSCCSRRLDRLRDLDSDRDNHDINEKIDDLNDQIHALRAELHDALQDDEEENECCLSRDYGYIDIQEYLDERIVWWRCKRDAGIRDEVMCSNYIDALQGVRYEVFGEVLKED